MFPSTRFTVFPKRNAKWIHLFFLASSVIQLDIMSPRVMSNKHMSHDQRSQNLILGSRKNQWVRYAFLLEKCVIQFQLLFDIFVVCEDHGRQAIYHQGVDVAVGGVANGHYVPDVAGPAKYADILEAYSTIPGRHGLWNSVAKSCKNTKQNLLTKWIGGQEIYKTEFNW